MAENFILSPLQRNGFTARGRWGLSSTKVSPHPTLWLKALDYSAKPLLLVYLSQPQRFPQNGEDKAPSFLLVFRIVSPEKCSPARVRTQLLVPTHAHLPTERQCPRSASSCCKTSFKKQPTLDGVSRRAFPHFNSKTNFLMKRWRSHCLKLLLLPRVSYLFKSQDPSHTNDYWCVPPLPVRVTRGLRGQARRAQAWLKA